MGLLTDPSTGQGKLTKFLLNNHTKICVLMYISGILYFCTLAYPSMNQSTYFSENALLPGLVKSEFREDNLARIFHEELLDEMKKYDDSIPYPWILAKFRQIGLDAYNHNFTLNYPLGKTRRFSGKNVYGILRAARATSTEALVISVPYRPPVSMQQSTAASIAIMLAFAKFANKEKYWAKDIIFLVTEHEQLGTQAWLEAYHEISFADEGILEYGTLKGRAGAIQAAINLELHDPIIGQIDIKIEGLNGQLPNLDLFNLAAKMCLKENAYHTFKQRHSRNFRDPVKDWNYAFRTLMAMVSTQATGIPNGNHGLFHRFGIEALTIEGFAESNLRGASKVNFLNIGRIIEGIFRSLNNLLERLHQSYFFYLLPSSDRFISIGLYMPAVCLIAGAAFIKACAMWCQLKKDEQDQENMKEGLQKVKKTSEEKCVKTTIKNDDEFMVEMKRKFMNEIKCHNVKIDGNCLDISTIFVVLLTVHFLGIVIMNSPKLITVVGNQYNLTTEKSLFFGFILISVLLSIIPVFVPFKNSQKSLATFQIISLLELGTALICISMNNFSLALFFSVVYVPFALFINISSNWFCCFMQKFYWFLLHPLLVLIMTVLIYTFFMFPGEIFKDNFHRGISATEQAIVFSIVDSMIYGNWLFSVITSIFLPNWLCLWIVAFSSVSSKNIVQDKKNK